MYYIDDIDNFCHTNHISCTFTCDFQDFSNFERSRFSFAKSIGWSQASQSMDHGIQSSKTRCGNISLLSFPCLSWTRFSWNSSSFSKNSFLSLGFPARMFKYTFTCENNNNSNNNNIKLVGGVGFLRWMLACWRTSWRSMRNQGPSGWRHGIFQRRETGKPSLCVLPKNRMPWDAMGLFENVGETMENIWKHHKFYAWFAIICH